ncbi:MAG: WD40/YVTN/BNR-like repeat-containing protein [Gaiellaceae bacterium]
MNAAVETDEGVYSIDTETEQVLDFVVGAELSSEDQPRVGLPLLVAAAAEGSTVVALLDRRPPLAVSHDAGSSWREAGGGLPPGRAIAIASGDPDRMLYAAAHRVYVSRDGGRFWRALEPELPEIKRVAWLD